MIYTHTILTFAIDQALQAQLFSLYLMCILALVVDVVVKIQAKKEATTMRQNTCVLFSTHI